jgi:3-hydroxyisobutyrate dehydrogenase
VLETDGEDRQNREHSCFFSAAHAARDSGSALQLARNLSLELPLARARQEQHDRMIGEGLRELDKSGIAELTSNTATKGPAITSAGQVDQLGIYQVDLMRT